MTPEEIHTRIAEGRDALLAAGSPGTYLVEEEALPLGELIDQARASDALVGLVPAFDRLPGSPYFSVRRLSAYVLYGQVECALADETVAQRARRFADDLNAMPGLNLPNELVAVYNRILDEARESGTDDPFVVGDTRAETRESGYSTIPVVYAQATLEACAAVLGPAPDEDPTSEEAEP